MRAKTAGASMKAALDSGLDAARRQDWKRLILTNRTILMVALLIIVIVLFSSLSTAGLTLGSYNADYLAFSAINLVPMGMLAIAELFVIVSGGGGIDLSVGSVVTLAGMLFGFMYGVWNWPLPVALVLTVLFGSFCGLVNGVLVAYAGYPPLIVTLATYYAMWSIALTVNDQKPISTPPIQGMYEYSKKVELPAWFGGQSLPLIPLGIFLFLIPTIIIVWVLVEKTTYGKRLYAIGTNDVAASWAGINVKRTRAAAYVASGTIAGLVAIVTVSQFASARPDSGISGNGMALPAITIAVLGGVAIFGGIGTVLGVILAAMVITWLNAGILLAFQGNLSGQIQLLALGILLIGSALLNGFTNRRFAGAR